MRSFSKSLTVSICLHGLAVAYFLSHPFLFKTPRARPLPSSTLDLPEVKQQVLENFFSNFAAAPSTTRFLLPTSIALKPFSEEFNDAPIEDQLTSQFTPFEDPLFPFSPFSTAAPFLEDFEIQDICIAMQNPEIEREYSDFLIERLPIIAAQAKLPETSLIPVEKEIYSPLTPEISYQFPSSFALNNSDLDEEQLFRFSPDAIEDTIEEYIAAFSVLPPKEGSLFPLADPHLEIHFVKETEEIIAAPTTAESKTEEIIAAAPDTSLPSLGTPEISIVTSKQPFSLSAPDVDLIEQPLSLELASPLKNEFEDFSDRALAYAPNIPEFKPTENPPQEADANATPTIENVIPFTSAEAVFSLPTIGEIDSLENQVLVSSSQTESDLLEPSFAFPIAAEWKDKVLSVKRSLPNVSLYGLLEQIPTILWNEDFEIDAHFEPRKDQKGFLFSLTLKPKFDMRAKSFPQNFYFIIDQKSSTDKQRLNSFRKGLLKAIEKLGPDDRFNILVLGSKEYNLFDSCTQATPASLRKARTFLEKLPPSSAFGKGDFINSLPQLLPRDFPASESHTAILLTTGSTKANPLRQRHAIEQWMQKNQGNLALYTAALGSENNLLLLDMLSSCNRGRLLYSDTHAAFPRKLTKLIMTLKNPIGKDLLATVIASSPKSSVQLLTTKTHLPDMVAGASYTLLGTTEDLSEFTLLLQGKHKEEWFTVKKTITPVVSTSPKKLTAAFHEKLALLSYQQYLKEGNVEALDNAESFLKSAHPRFPWK